jgi:simple sugar transport system ATP-binding protein
VSDKTFSFSGGMLQRILLAREFSELRSAENAGLIVLAEPGSGLDLINRTKLEEELKTHVRRGAGALVFSTDMDELISVADEILILKNGTLIANEN